MEERGTIERVGSGRERDDRERVGSGRERDDRESRQWKREER